MTEFQAPIHILIVDDDEDDFFLAQDLLEDIGKGRYQLEWAPSYADGLRCLTENRHHLCLMDYKLGAQDGIALLGEAQQLGFNGPVILLTGMRQGEVDIQALEAGAVDYLVKAELTSERLERSVRYALARREVELERIERLRAESENRSKSEFLAHLSHELRTPLSAVLGFTELMISKAHQPEELGHLKVIQRNGKHLLGLLNDILDLSKIEAGKLELEVHWINLTTFLSDTYLLMQGAALDKNLSFTLEATSDLPQFIQTDPTRLRQVLLNLIGNALKFTEQGSVQIEVSYNPNSTPGSLHFSIADSGVGISENDLSTIFEPFVQSSGSSLNASPGTGLGLAISRQLVEKLGGTISANSRLGEGSVFSFSIDPGPQSDIETCPFKLQLELDGQNDSLIPSFKGRVLVVDDMEDIRALIGHFVALTGVQVDFACNGEEAEEHIRNNDYDLVLMDIHMPVQDGLETAENLARQGNTIPLVALTAAHMRGDRDRCLNAGFASYLSKPIDQQSLYTCLSEYLQEDSSAHSEEQNNAEILLVEDNDDAREAMVQLMTLSGHAPIAAANATEALCHANNLELNAVITDLNLPDMNGYQLAEKLRSIHPHIRIYALSGSAPDEQRAEAAGIDQHLIKPLSLDALQQVLSQLN